MVKLGSDGKIPLNPGILRSEPPRLAMHPNQVILVDDGSCPQGQIQQVHAGHSQTGQQRTKQCILRQ
jgi:hypothetical protein